MSVCARVSACVCRRTRPSLRASTRTRTRAAASMHPHLNEVYPYPRTRQPQLREAYSDAGGYVYTGGGVLRVWGTCRCVATSTSEVSGSVGRLSAGFQQPAVRLHLRVRGEGDIVGNYATARYVALCSYGRMAPCGGTRGVGGRGRGDAPQERRDWNTFLFFACPLDILFACPLSGPGRRRGAAGKPQRPQRDGRGTRVTSRCPAQLHQASCCGCPSTPRSSWWEISG